MELDFTAEEEAFRREVRDFLAAELPPSLREAVARGLPIGKAEQRDWQRALHRRGWAAPAWPVEHGGTGWTPAQRYLFQKEMGLGCAPPVFPTGIGMVGPVLCAFGTPAQQARFLPRILAAEEWWCQGFSEPGAGSDLAALRTTARREGGEYRVDGQKIWTSKARWADFMFLLARTGRGARPQEGISFLLVDMRTPGITIRPIRSIDGQESLSEVFLDGVRVPAENLVGEEGGGWACARYLLGHERHGIAGVARMWSRFGRLRRIAAAEPALQGEAFRHRMAELEADLLAVEFLELRALSAERDGTATGAEPSLLKLAGTELLQRLTTLLAEALGPHAALRDVPEESLAPDWAEGIMQDHLYSRAVTIYGGTSEVQRNILAALLLDR